MKKANIFPINKPALQAAKAAMAAMTLFVAAYSAQMVYAQAGRADAKAPSRWNDALLKHEPSWYASPEARAIADSVRQWQSLEGGWPKNLDLTYAPQLPEDLENLIGGKSNTIDNGATTMPIIYLSRMVAATSDPKYRASLDRGLDYLLKSQYPNGGWPQYYPLEKGYYTHITFNDDAMIDVMTILRDVADGKGAYNFVDDERRAKAADAIKRGLDIILRTQLKVNGKLAGWCAQYDETTLKPAWARKYEPPSLSGNESVAIVRYLMQIEKPSAEVVAAVDGAVSWFKDAALKGVRIENFTNSDGLADKRVVTDSKAPLIWARFYELETSRPIFLGRDSQFKYSFGEIEHERRNGYGYYGTWPAKLVSTDYPAWKAKHPN